MNVVSSSPSPVYGYFYNQKYMLGNLHVESEYDKIEQDTVSEATLYQRSVSPCKLQNIVDIVKQPLTIYMLSPFNGGRMSLSLLAKKKFDKDNENSFYGSSNIKKIELQVKKSKFIRKKII